MNNQILSLNISNLKTFIKSQNFTDNKLIISFKYIIPNILFHFINQNLNPLLRSEQSLKIFDSFKILKN